MKRGSVFTPRKPSRPCARWVGAPFDIITTQRRVVCVHRQCIQISAPSTARDRDEILPGSEGVAFGRPGAVAGDLIDLTAIDANDERGDDQAFRFGASETIAGLWLVEEGDATLVRASVDEDADAEFELAILDGSVRAADYTSDDFAL